MAIETERLIIRHFTKDDAEAVLRIYGDMKANKFLPWFPASSIEDAKAILRCRYFDLYAEGWDYAYAICMKDDYPIGYIKADMDDSHDFGYGIRHEFWHKGITTEAAIAVIGKMRDDGLEYITATHDRNNPYSGAVMRKARMVYKYSYEELWQPKNLSVVFRMYQLDLDGAEHGTYMKYWNQSPNHFIEHGL